MILTFLRAEACKEAAAELLRDGPEHVACADDTEVLTGLLAYPGATLLVDVEALQQIGVDAIFRIDDAVRSHRVACGVMVPQAQAAEEALIRSMTRLQNFWQAPFLKATIPPPLRGKLLVGSGQETQQTFYRELPALLRGRLRPGLLFDLLWSLRLQGWFGSLVLESRGSTESIRVGHGRLRHVEAERASLLRLFAWDTGHYRFEGEEPSEAEGGAAIEELLLQAFHAHTTLNGNAAWMQDSANRRLHVSVDAGERLGATVRFEPVREVLELGESQPDVDRLWEVGMRAPRLLATLRFCEHVGAVGFLEKGSVAPFSVLFRHPEEDPLPTVSSAPSRGLDDSAAIERSRLVEEMKEVLRARQKVLQGPDPAAVLGLDEGASEEEIEGAYYAALRENHPDIYAHVRDAEVRALAEDLFLALRSMRRRIMRIARTSGSHRAVPEAKQSGGAAAEEVNPRTRRNVVVHRPGEGHRVIQADVSGTHERPPMPDRPTPLSRSAVLPSRVDDERHRERAARLAERARAMQADGSARSISPDEAADRAARRAAVDRLRMRREVQSGVSSDQLLRVANQAMEGGAWQRALEHFESIRDRGDLDVPALSGLLDFCRWQVGEIEEAELLRRIQDLVQASSGEASSRAIALQGHVHRLGGQYTKAAERFKEAVRTFPDNHEAFRWHRYCSGRKDVRRRSSPVSERSSTSSPTSTDTEKKSPFDLGRIFRRNQDDGK